MSRGPSQLADVLGSALVSLGATQVFGVVGATNFRVTHALVAAGARFTASRHEAGAVTMADAYSRTSGCVPVVSVNTGNGLTNALTGLTEAVKSRTPLLVLAPGVPAGRRHAIPAYADQAALSSAVGAEFHLVTSCATALAETAAAYRRASLDGATVVLEVPTDVLTAEPLAASAAVPSARPVPEPAPAGETVAELARLLESAQRPVFIAGRGARGSGAELRALAGRFGALLATSLPVRGLFAGDPWDLDVAGGFSTPVSAELIAHADLVVAWGAGLNDWTTRQGTLLGPQAKVARVDHDPRALAARARVDLPVQAGVRPTAAALLAATGPVERPGYRSAEVAARIRKGAHWRDIPFDEVGGPGLIDPRTLTLSLDALLPDQRRVVSDIGNFSSYPILFPRIHNEGGLLVPIGFGCLGLGLASAVGAAIADPSRLTVACIGDGGFMMGIAELDTVVRERLPLLIVVYNDSSYGAEAQQFGPLGLPVDIVTFPDTDIAAIARGHGLAAVTVRDAAELDPVAAWLRGPRDGALVVDAKTSAFPSFLMEHIRRD